MLKYMLDTNIAIDVIKRRPLDVLPYPIDPNRGRRVRYR